MFMPHGLCECTEGIVAMGCCQGLGPAAYQAERDGKPVVLCTRCIVDSDMFPVVLVTEEDSFQQYAEFDMRGAFILQEQLNAQVVN